MHHESPNGLEARLVRLSLKRPTDAHGNTNSAQKSGRMTWMLAAANSPWKDGGSASEQPAFPN